jgi:beta-glucosidase
MQSNGVITSTKVTCQPFGVSIVETDCELQHYIAYEQETNRVPNVNNTVQSISSNLDDQTMHEIYLWPFQEAVLAGSGNIMCSYNRINNSYASQNSKTLNGILKTELGFQGFVVSDWGAQYVIPSISHSQ